MTPPPADDRALVRRLQAGDEAAFEAFFAAHFPPLYRFALARLRDDVAAEEVVQAALGRALTRLHTWRGEAALLTWLHTFCRHEISAWCARAARRPVEVDLVDDLPEVRAALDALGAPDPETTLRRAEIAGLVQTALDRLPGRHADALEWKYIDGLSVAEIAARLGVTTKAAESLLARARESFRDAFLTLTQPQPGGAR